MEEPKIFTKKDYLAGKCSHREFYGQFVNETVKNIITRWIGLENLLHTSDKEHFNSIPLKKWDNLADNIAYSMNMNFWKQAVCPEYIGKKSFSWSKSDVVCIGKEAAKQIVEEAGNEI